LKLTDRLTSGRDLPDVTPGRILHDVGALLVDALEFHGVKRGLRVIADRVNAS